MLATINGQPQRFRMATQGGVIEMRCDDFLNTRQEENEAALIRLSQEWMHVALVERTSKTQSLMRQLRCKTGMPLEQPKI
jgi:hypothetical protein